MVRIKMKEIQGGSGGSSNVSSGGKGGNDGHVGAGGGGGGGAGTFVYDSVSAGYIMSWWWCWRWQGGITEPSRD